jgi:exosome complex RNA-binding protein Rrp4
VQRRNRPNLAIGDLVYARVTVASRDMEPELACTDASGKVALFSQKQLVVELRHFTAPCTRSAPLACPLCIR